MSQSHDDHPDKEIQALRKALEGAYAHITLLATGEKPPLSNAELCSMIGDVLYPESHTVEKGTKARYQVSLKAIRLLTKDMEVEASSESEACDIALEAVGVTGFRWDESIALDIRVEFCTES